MQLVNTALSLKSSVLPNVLPEVNLARLAAVTSSLKYPLAEVGGVMMMFLRPRRRTASQK